jgi:ADP-heptose:LPS heptosyltransferase
MSSKKILVKIGAAGMGDALLSTPALRKLSYFYNNTSLSIKTKYPDLFKNNPYIDEIIKRDEYLDQTDYEVFEIYKGDGKLCHACYCGRSCAYDLGFDLKDDELGLDFYPDLKSIYEIHKLNNYICLHTTSNWSNRTWSEDNWKKLILLLQNTDLNIVLIGKDYEEVYFDGSICKKRCFEASGKNIINFTNDGSSIHDLWHLINNSKGIVTIDSGPLHIAGTTDTWIFQIGSARHPKFVAPYRNGSQNYKHEYIGGECKLFCASNLRYTVKEWKTIKATHFLPACQENYTEMKCHPTAESVFNKIKEKLNLH